jgi:hypothetical protein
VAALREEAEKARRNIAEFRALLAPTASGRAVALSALFCRVVERRRQDDVERDK